MFQAIYEFTKFFSIIFIFAGLSCLGNEFYGLAILMFATSAIIKFIDSDWAFYHFNFNNHNLFVVICTLFLVFLNSFYIIENLKYSPVFIKATDEQKVYYREFEENLYYLASPCIVRHNRLINKKLRREKFSEAEANNANMVCLGSMKYVNKLSIPNDVPDEIKPFLGNLKTNMKYITLNLSGYNYSKDNKNVDDLIKMNVRDLDNEIIKIRSILQLSTQLDDEKKNLVKTME